MKDLVKILQTELINLEVAVGKLKGLKEDFEKAAYYIKEIVQEQTKVVADLKAQIEPLAIQEFKDTGKKKLYGGIGIQEKNVLEYEEKKAFYWALDKGICLSLHKKDFEKVASTMNLDFVTKGKVEKVTYPKEIKLEE